MTTNVAPLFGCFPICLTFVAIGVIGILAVAAVGLNRTGPNLPEPEVASAAPTPPGYGPPSWRVVALIFAIVLLHFVLLLWCWPDL